MVAGSVAGFYLAFDSVPDIELALERLDPRAGRLHPELMSVHQVQNATGVIERAIVFVPDGTLQHFLTRLEQYAETASDDKPRNQELVDRIQQIRLASLQALWTDPPAEFPDAASVVWWEVWLRRRDGNEVSRFHQFAELAQIRVGSRTLGFGDRTVILAHASAEQLASALTVLDDLAELRRPHELAQLISLEGAADQAEWVDALAQRVTPPGPDAPAVAVLDTGVHAAHPLLSSALDKVDCHACDPDWEVGDHKGHGTEMAGLALYGDVGAALLTSDPVGLRHRLESVKVLPPPPRTNPPDLYGAVTATAASLVEIQQPDRERVFCLAVTAEDRPADEPASVYGQPTSWSAAVDALACGRSIDVSPDGLVYLDERDDAARRLFLISAGNITTFQDDHLTRSDVEPVQDPGQAWNALTVGAYTQLDSLAMAGPQWADYVPLAPRGELSPFSRTSVPFAKGWPVKPDVVLEGGNVARSPGGGSYDTPEELQVLTTKAPIRNQRLLTVTNATSAATAQAAYLAASTLATYPAMWPETVRALVVHSAEWSDVMWANINSARRENSPIAKVRALYRRYGMGVPDLERATRSAADALTLIVQDTIRPFTDGKMREMHVHDLPWPTEILAELGPASVRLRVTLSYFVEPNPGRRGWRRRYSYASHGLRFDVRRPTESMDDFRQRLNRLALAEEERRPQTPADKGWILGPDTRTVGSLHCDFWEGTAAELSSRGALAIYPVTGWWKENPKRDGSAVGARYALIVSIETPGQEVDIWTPVAEEIGVPITVTV